MVGKLDISSVQDVQEAVKTARNAFESWKNTPIKKRISYIQKFRDLVDKNRDEIAKLTTLEMGKVLSESKEDIDFELGFVDYYIQKGEEFLADEVVHSNGKEEYRVVFEPYGVCAVIAPWNFPLSMANSGILPALLAGNTVVFKPSEYTSLTQKKVIELLWEAGVPKDVLHIVIGAGEVGSALIDSEIDFAWFTGSTKTGQEIYKKCGEKFIKAVCEMGGSSAGIVFADCDLESTLNNVYVGRFLNCGQVCSAIKRLFVEKSIYNTFVKKLVERIKVVKVGNPLEDNNLGPLVSRKQLQLLEGQVQDALSKGAKVEIGGKKPCGKEYEKGNYFEPTILTNVNFDMKVLSEEVFGPVLPIVPFKAEEEALEMANKTQYGLSSEVFTKDLERGQWFAKRLQSGVVAINIEGYYKPFCPIGGYKKSGMGREYGKIGMQEFTQVKLLALKKSS